MAHVSSAPSVPMTQWTRLATNQFDLEGDFEFTNPIVGAPQLFYRLELP
jgi:hypothetical protein